MKRSIVPIMIVVGLLVGLIVSSLFTVSERELAIKFQFGRIVKADYQPGLHFKVPIYNTVQKFDKRILTIDRPPERFLTGEGNFLNVDFFIKWRIRDVSQFYRATAGDEQIASNRLTTIITNTLKSQFATLTIQESVAEQRTALMLSLLRAVEDVSTQYGVELVDVRVKRVDLPEEVSERVFQRMRQERVRDATLNRAEGAELAEEIRATAERDRTVILAEANREAEQIRGEGDARSAEVYAGAYSPNPEFYSFYRSMQAYRSSLGRDQDILILRPGDNEFFKYLNRSGQ
ncbi:MAG: protease modulator HflC [Gammaproteobacteria bacterium]